MASDSFDILFTGAMVLDLPPSVGGIDGVTDYFQLFDKLLDLLTAAQKE